MQIQMRLGTEQDLDALETLYDDLNDYLASTTNYPGWQKGVYPVRQDAEDAIRDQCLWVALDQGNLVGSIILLHKPDPAYLKVTWQAALKDEQVWILHTFAVSPQKQTCGIGRCILEFVEQYAQEQHVKALRLDVFAQNLPAIALYESCGYQYIDTVSLGLEQYGLDWFKLYEKLV